MKSSARNDVPDPDIADHAVIKQAILLAKSEAESVNMKTQIQLSQARQNAVQRMEQLSGVGHAGHSLYWLGGLSAYLRQPKMLFIALLLTLLTLSIVQQYTHQEQIQHSDALLLAADLPPEAFADKGFNQWVEFVGR